MRTSIVDSVLLMFISAHRIKYLDLLCQKPKLVHSVVETPCFMWAHRIKMKTFTAIVYFMSVLFTTVQSQLECPSVCTCSFPTPGNSLIDCSNRGLTEVLEVSRRGAGNIAKIDFSNNMLTTLDIDKLYTNIVGLQVDVLDFSFNSINAVTGTFDANAGRDYETLNLSNNALTSFPENVIPVTHIRTNLILDFSYNRLTKLTAHMFAGGTDILIPGFRFLGRNNLISKIDDETFQGVDLTDTVLDLRYNHLETLSQSFQSPRGVKSLKFSGNPWICDCNLRWIIAADRFLINQTELDPPNCRTPVSLRERPIFGLRENEFTCLPYQQGLLRQNFTNTDNFTLSCPVTADPPNPVISWTVWLPCPSGGDPLQFDFDSDTVTLSDITTNPRAAFRCTATNNAGSVDLDLDIRYNDESGIPIPDSPSQPAATQTPVTFQAGSQPPSSANGGISMGSTASSDVGTNDGMKEGSGGKPVGSIIVLVIVLLISWLIIAILIYLILKLKNKSKGVQNKAHTKHSGNGHISELPPITYSNVTRSNGWNGAVTRPEQTIPTYAAPDKSKQQVSPMKPKLPVKPAMPARPAPPLKPSNPYQYNTDQEYDEPPLKVGLYNDGYDYNNRDSFI